MNEREFWVQIRRGLLVMIDAIGTRYDLPRSADLGLNHNSRRHQFQNGSHNEPPLSALAQSNEKERA